MTDNQNMNKTSMKDMQQQHFYQFKTASLRENWNVSVNLDSFVLCLFVCKIFSIYRYFLPATTTTGYSLKPFSFHLQPEN